MTEDQWLKSREITPMLDCCWESQLFSIRASRLFMIACCRLVWDYLLDERSRQAVEVGERFADGRADREDVWSAEDRAREAFLAWADMLRDENVGLVRPLMSAANAAFHGKYVFSVGKSGPLVVAGNVLSTLGNVPAAEALMCAILRDIVGNPFAPPIRVDPTWITDAVKTAATAADEQRIMPQGTLDPSLLQKLTDALREAGCGEEAILAHLQESVHVRGCNVLDLLLNKE